MSAGAGSWLVGTSGWAYPSWRPTFYPPAVPQSQWLRRCAEEFPIVELNATFYRLARTAMAQRWAESTPDHFRFVVKGSRFLTHTRKLADLDGGIRRFFSPLEPLEPKITAVLWQLPLGCGPM